jgi:hypothetical protein
MVWIGIRYHTVQEFNKGVYDYIIATDESSTSREQDSEDEDSNGEEEAEDNDDDGKTTHMSFDAIIDLSRYSIRCGHPACK